MIKEKSDTAPPWAGSGPFHQSTMKVSHQRSIILVLFGENKPVLRQPVCGFFFDIFVLIFSTIFLAIRSGVSTQLVLRRALPATNGGGQEPLRSRGAYPVNVESPEVPDPSPNSSFLRGAFWGLLPYVPVGDLLELLPTTFLPVQVFLAAGKTPSGQFLLFSHLCQRATATALPCKSACALL